MSSSSQGGGLYSSINISRDRVAGDGFVTWCVSIRRVSVVPSLRPFSRGIKRKLMRVLLPTDNARLGMSTLYMIFSGQSYMID